MSSTYFIKCTQCGNLNPFKTEFITFCEHCNKKLQNNFVDWKKLNTGKTIDDFRKEICVRKDSVAVSNSPRRKLKSSTLFIAIGIVAGILITMVVISPSRIKNFFLPSTLSAELLKSEWQRTTYGKLGISMQSPEKLQPATLEIPADFIPYINEAESFSYRPSKFFVVTLNSILFNEGVQVRLDGAYRAVMNDLLNNKAISNLEFKESPLVSDDVMGVLVEGSYHEQGTFMRFQCAIYLKGSKMWQVWVNFDGNDPVGREVAERIMNSIQISYFVKSI